MYLGLDLGTGSAKALLLDANGATVGETSAAYHAVSPHAGWSEIDPEIWLQALSTCVQALPAGARAAVKGIGLSGLGCPARKRGGFANTPAGRTRWKAFRRCGRAGCADLPFTEIPIQILG